MSAGQAPSAASPAVSAGPAGAGAEAASLADSAGADARSCGAGTAGGAADSAGSGGPLQASIEAVATMHAEAPTPGRHALLSSRCFQAKPTLSPLLSRLAWPLGVVASGPFS